MDIKKNKKTGRGERRVIRNSKSYSQVHQRACALMRANTHTHSGPANAIRTRLNTWSGADEPGATLATDDMDFEGKVRGNQMTSDEML